MAITYSLAPIPRWILINNEGTVAGGGKLYTRSARNIDQDKAVFQDAGGTMAYTNPILFDLNGVAPGAFYWAVNSADLGDTYFLKATDANDNELWTIPSYSPPGSGGGGGNITTYIPLTNYIANNQFIDNVDDTVTTALTNLVVAPSNHKGFTPALINPIVGNAGVVGPDIRFVKNSTANTDQITFPLFPLASSPLTGDVTPVNYVRYQCTTGNPGETYKCFQFPICQKIKNLSNNTMSFNIWAAVTATPATVNVYVRQYFGSAPTASAEVRDLVGALSLTTTWTQFPITLTIPDVALKSIGTPGAQTDDDALYIQLEMPLNTPCDILFTKPALYLGGDINPNQDFDDYDQINSINSTPRTGDIKTSLLSSAPNGWVAMNDGSIGNVGSGATNRANKDTFQLFKTIWDGVFNNTWAPILTSSGAPSTYGATAVADFIANKRLTLPRSLGRALAGAGSGAGLTPRALGQYLGEETHVLTIAEMPSHTHSALAGSFIVNTTTGGSPGNLVAGSNTGLSGTTASRGNDAAHNIMQPTSFFNVFIKL